MAPPDQRQEGFAAVVLRLCVWHKKVPEACLEENVYADISVRDDKRSVLYAWQLVNDPDNSLPRLALASLDEATHITSLCGSSPGTLRSKSSRKSLAQTNTSYLWTYVISRLLGDTDQIAGEQQGQRNVIWRGRETHQYGLISDNCML